jgi:hypothetical protein
LLRHYAINRNIGGSRHDEINYFFSNYLNLPAALGPGIYSVPETEINMFLGRTSRPVRKAGKLTLPPPVCRLFRHCGILNISQPRRPPRSGTGTALLFYMYMMFVLHRKHIY